MRARNSPLRVVSIFRAETRRGPRRELAGHLVMQELVNGVPVAGNSGGCPTAVGKGETVDPALWPNCSITDGVSVTDPSGYVFDSISHETRLVSTGLDETVRLWDVETRQQTTELRGHTGGVWVARFAPVPGTIV